MVDLLMDSFWQYKPMYDSEYSKPQLVDLSVERFLFNEISFIEMIWFWIWVWLGVQQSEHADPFYLSESVCAYGVPEYDCGISMNSGPFDAQSWHEWVVQFPYIGYAIRGNSNY